MDGSLEQTAAEPAVRVQPLRRPEWPPWSYYPSRLLALLLLWPILRILQLFGVFPRAMSRGFNRMTSSAGPFEPEPNDVLIGSYFKSGTNWTMQTALQIAHHGRAEFEHVHDLAPWYELPQREGRRYTVSMNDQRVREGADRALRVIKTHLSMDDLGYSPNGHYVWVVRDPKDVFVSGYRFIKSAIMGPLMPSLRSWLDLYLSPDSYTGSWAVHLKSGWELRDRDNVLFLTFEEMKADRLAAVNRIAELLRVELSDAELDEVVKRASFEHMKSISYKFDTLGLSPPWVRPRGAMVRRGQPGSASELLTLEDQHRIDDYWRGELCRLGCDFPYDPHYGARPAATPD